MLNINGLLDKKVKIKNYLDDFSTQGTVVGAYQSTVCGGESTLHLLVQNWKTDEVNEYRFPGYIVTVIPFWQEEPKAELPGEDQPQS